MAALPLGMFVGTMLLSTASDYQESLGFVAMLLLYSLATLIGGIGYSNVALVAAALAALLLSLLTWLSCILLASAASSRAW